MPLTPALLTLHLQPPSNSDLQTKPLMQWVFCHPVDKSFPAHCFLSTKVLPQAVSVLKGSNTGSSFQFCCCDSKNEACMLGNDSFHPFPVGNQVSAHNLVLESPGETCCLVFLFTACTEIISPPQPKKPLA